MGIAAKNHILLFDPVPFKGGSKIATDAALSLTKGGKVKYTVLTADVSFWQESDLAKECNTDIVRFPMANTLMSCNQGLLFWVKQFYLLLVLSITRLKQGKFHCLLGASGPGNDMALYLFNQLLGATLIQLIHGPVSPSRSIGWCLMKVHKVHYLHSSRTQLQAALSRHYERTHSRANAQELAKLELNGPRFCSFVNGIKRQHWPSQCNKAEPVLFWAASLLKWKGLDLMCDGIQVVHRQKPIAANICFIRPQNISVPTSDAPKPLPYVLWYQEPRCIDEIRKQSNIFISTSKNEPFGLSILEAMAAGMCIVIPRDGAYWDKRLSSYQNCLKYQPDNADSLAQAILSLTEDKMLATRISKASKQIAEQYRAEEVYAGIVHDVLCTESCLEIPSGAHNSLEVR
ncbi:glycosyltransferase family 4 protein [Vibrio sonorensis]|uniref:glycosyltransferase family 4 protein n=1 Tax=Vibrio sonorensis TaxID=1004316 RepID=UPI0008DA562B|nr:glycosyltransferase family 4 protein [Vibrio sonorensis]